MRALGCSPARASHSLVRRDRLVPSSFRINGCPASHWGVTLRGAAQAEGTNAITGSRRQGITVTPRTEAMGKATRPTSSVPRASRDTVSCDVSTTTCTSMPGWCWPSTSSAWGSRCAMAPVDAPRRTRPSSPCTWRRTRSMASSASASRRRARSTSTSPAPDGRTSPRLRTSNGAPINASRSAMCRLTVGGARCSVRAASAKDPRSAMVTRVRSRSRLSSRMTFSRTDLKVCEIQLFKV